MQKVYNTISVLTFALVTAQLVGVAYLYSNRESIKDAVIDEAISAVLSSVSLPGLDGALPGADSIPSVMPEATSAPEIGVPSVQMFTP
mgnify:FL=1